MRLVRGFRKLLEVCFRGGGQVEIHISVICSIKHPYYSGLEQEYYHSNISASKPGL